VSCREYFGDLSGTRSVIILVIEQADLMLVWKQYGHGVLPKK
jgi:hypothetical protein